MGPQLAAAAWMVAGSASSVAAGRCSPPAPLVKPRNIMFKCLFHFKFYNNYNKTSMYKTIKYDSKMYNVLK